MKGLRLTLANARDDALVQIFPDAKCEEVVFNEPLLVALDTKLSEIEPRFHALGKSNNGKKLLAVFAARGNKLRVISVRDMSRKERAVHESEQARIFWQTQDSTDYIDWSSAQQVSLPKLRPTLKSISLRLPEPLLARLRTMANERDIPYQSLIKMILAEHVEAHSSRCAG